MCLKSTPFVWDVIAEGLLYHLNLYRSGEMGEPFSDMCIQERLSG